MEEATVARVIEFEKITRERAKVHGVVQCTYCVFHGPDGKRYLTLETYGSPGREYPDKVSQSLQFDEEAVGRLIQLIHASFPSLR